jgi:hypothetical protein
MESKQPATSNLDICGLLACLSIWAFLVIWITLASGSFNLRAVAFLGVLPWILLRVGGLITMAIRLPSFFALDFLLGVAVVSIGVMAWKLFMPLSLWVLLIVLLIVGIPKVLPRSQRDPLSRLGLLGVIASLVAATGWSHDLILPTSAVGGEIVFKPWSDFFVHATMVGRSLSNETLLQFGNYEWLGFPAIFYHYASYSLASCLAKAGQVPTYATVVGFWAPFGSFLTGLASYAVGRAIWTQGAGLAALIAAFLVPDVWLLNIAHPIYGYFWLLHVSPGGLYAIAIAGTALILVVQGTREGRRLWIASGVVAGVLAAFSKIQVFVAAFPLLLSFAILAWPSRKRWRWVVLSGCVAVTIAILPFVNRFYVGPNVQIDLSGNTWYWKMLADMSRGTNVEGWYRVFSGAESFPAHLPRAIGLLLLNALGVFAVIAPLVWLLAMWHKTWQLSESISMAAVVILLAMTFGLGGNGIWSNAQELIHRPFIWAYWLIGSLTMGRLFSIAAARWPRLAIRVVTVSVVVLMLVPVCYGSGLQQGKWLQANAYSSLRVDRGLIDCARYIRSQAPVSAVAQDSHLDPLLILGALSERRAFAARLELWKGVSKAFRQSAYQEQLRKLKSLREATNIPDLQRSVRETGIRWYVVHPGDPNVWPAEFRDQPIFESNGYRVYDMQRCFELRG